MTVRQQCEECGVILYNFKNGIAESNPHKPTCSRRNIKAGTQFFVGERVRRREYFLNDYWHYGDKLMTITYVSPDNKSLMFERDQLDEGAVNAFESHKFEKEVDGR